MELTHVMHGSSGRPRKLPSTTIVTALERIPGVPVSTHAARLHEPDGQDLIALGLAEPVLAACGRMLRRIHAIDPGLVLPAAPLQPGAVLVHGDYGRRRSPPAGRNEPMRGGPRGGALIRAG
jgi:hypothetical protein